MSPTKTNCAILSLLHNRVELHPVGMSERSGFIGWDPQADEFERSMPELNMQEIRDR